MQYGIYSANEWVYTDSPAQGGGKISLLAPRGSFACVQLRTERDGLRWRFEGDGALRPALYRLLPVFVEKNTGERGFTVGQGTEVPYAPRMAPFWVYDAMEPADPKLTAPRAEAPLALYVKIPTAGLHAGEYRTTLVLTEDTAEETHIPITVTVAAVSVPRTETLRLTNWYSLGNMATYHEAEPWSEDHWDRIEMYGRKMREGRQTDFQVPFPLAEPHRGDDGTYTFDFSRAERFIELYLSLGFRFIEGDTPVYREEWSRPDFVVSIGGKPVPALSEEGYAFLQGYFTGWYRLLREHHWLDFVYQHVADEPHDDCAAAYRILSGMVRKWMPGVRVIEAVENPRFDGAVDVWVPKDDSYERDREAYERKRLLGDELWFYTCCCPGGRYLNRLLDEELLRTRYLHWGNFRYGLTGYLHWGLNHYECTDDPYAGRAGSIETLSVTALPCGDSHILYPKGKEVLGSVRFEMMRAGCEDYELLQRLRQRDPAAAEAVAARCVRSFSDYTAEVPVFEAAYAALLHALGEEETV